MTDTMFVVMEKSYQFNDETYGEVPDHGQPRHLFATRQEAEAEIAKRNRDHVRTLGRSGYPFGNDEYFCEKADLAMLALSKVLGTPFDQASYWQRLDQGLHDLTDEQLDRFFCESGLTYFYIKKLPRRLQSPLLSDWHLVLSQRACGEGLAATVVGAYPNAREADAAVEVWYKTTQQIPLGEMDFELWNGLDTWHLNLQVWKDRGHPALTIPKENPENFVVGDSLSRSAFIELMILFDAPYHLAIAQSEFKRHFI